MCRIAVKALFLWSVTVPAHGLTVTDNRHGLSALRAPQQGPKHSGNKSHHKRLRGAGRLRRPQQVRGVELTGLGVTAAGSTPAPGPSVQPPENQQRRGILHFLFMLSNGLPHQEIWRRFFEDAPRGSYSVWAHCAGSCNMQFLLEALPLLHVVPTVQSAYCADLVTPMTQLLKNALANSPDTPGYIQKFLFVSDTTLPIKPFHRIYDYFTADDTSDMCFVNPHTWASLRVHGQSVYVVKHSQWAALNREHAAKLSHKWQSPNLEPKDGASLGGRWNVTVPAVPEVGEGNETRADSEESIPRTLFAGSKKKFGCADEEAIFASLFGSFIPPEDGEKFIPGIGNLTSSGSSAQGHCTTFVAWEPEGNDLISAISGDPESSIEKNRTHKNAHPLFIRKLGRRSAALLRSSQYLFARKFSLDVNVEDYERMFFDDEPEELIQTRLSTNYTAMLENVWCNNWKSRLTQQHNMTKEQCMGLCTAEPSCRYVTFATERGTCATWNSCGSPLSSKLSGAVLYSRTPAQTYKLLALGQGCGVTDQDDWLAGGAGYTLAQCQNECTQTRGCIFVTYGDPDSEKKYNQSRADPGFASCDLWSKCTLRRWRENGIRPLESLDGTYEKAKPVAYPVFERGIWCGAGNTSQKLSASMGHTLESCQDQCSGDHSCNYFSFHKKSSWCATWTNCSLQDGGSKFGDVAPYASFASYVKVQTNKLSDESGCRKLCSSRDVRSDGERCFNQKDEAACESSHTSENGELYPCMWANEGGKIEGSCIINTSVAFICHSMEASCDSKLGWIRN